MEDFFTGIQWFFENILFAPFNALAELQLESWWLANFLNFLFIAILVVAFIYWMNQLHIFHNTDEEREDVNA